VKTRETVARDLDEEFTAALSAAGRVALVRVLDSVLDWALGVLAADAGLL
jgi:hypothetical protein